MSGRPLMLVTRPQPGAMETAGRLEALGIEPLVTPLMRMRVLSPGLPEPEGLGALALTSTNALRALIKEGRLARYLGLPVFAVGSRTASEARALGFENVADANGAFPDLVAMIRRANPKGPVFYPATTTPTGDLAAALAPAGILVLTAHVYEMRPLAELPAPAHAALSGDRAMGVALYSHDSAALFASLASAAIGPERRGGLVMLCLSEKTARPLIASGFGRIALADHPSEEAMMALALSFARHQIR